MAERLTTVSLMVEETADGMEEPVVVVGTEDRPEDNQIIIVDSNENGEPLSDPSKSRATVLTS